MTRRPAKTFVTLALLAGAALLSSVAPGQGSAQGKRSYTNHHFQLETATHAGGVLGGAKRRAPRHSIKRKPLNGGHNQMKLDDTPGSAK